MANNYTHDKLHVMSWQTDTKIINGCIIDTMKMVTSLKYSYNVSVDYMKGDYTKKTFENINSVLYHCIIT